MLSPQTVYLSFHHAKLQVLLMSKQSLLILFSMQSFVLLHGCNLQFFSEQSLLILFSMQSYKSYYMVSRKQSLLILFSMQSYKSYYMVSPQTVFTYPFQHAKLQVLLHGVTANSNLVLFSMQTANSLYLSFSACKATSLTTWCHRKQSLLILFSMQSYKYYYMVSQQTVFTYPFQHAKLQVLLHGVTANSLYLSFSVQVTTWCHRKQSLLILFSMQSYKSLLQVIF